MPFKFMGRIPKPGETWRHGTTGNWLRRLSDRSLDQRELRAVKKREKIYSCWLNMAGGDPGIAPHIDGRHINTDNLSAYARRQDSLNSFYIWVDEDEV